MRPETYNLNKALIISALANISAWENWTEAVPIGAAKALNLSLIRLTKGLVKAWRIFLSDQGQQQYSASSRNTPSSLHLEDRS